MPGNAPSVNAGIDVIRTWWLAPLVFGPRRILPARRDTWYRVCLLGCGWLMCHSRGSLVGTHGDLGGASSPQQRIPTYRQAMPWTSAEGGNPGGRRTRVDCSNAYASRISNASLQALPKNEMPTGSPCTNPAGTVMLG